LAKKAPKKIHENLKIWPNSWSRPVKSLNPTCPTDDLNWQIRPVCSIEYGSIFQRPEPIGTSAGQVQIRANSTCEQP